MYKKLVGYPVTMFKILVSYPVIIKVCNSLVPNYKEFVGYLLTIFKELVGYPVTPGDGDSRVG